MRMVWSALAASLALAACGGDDGPTACEVGPEILADALAALHEAEPVCVRDDECVFIRTDVACDGFSSSLCGNIMHRAAAASWSADSVCKQIEDVARPGKYECSVQASCVQAGTPVCRAGRCVGSEN